MTLKQLKIFFGTVGRAVKCANRNGYENITKYSVMRSERLIKEHEDIFKIVVKKMAEDFNK